MVFRFTRWTAPCGCCFELESDPDSNKAADRDNHFAMVNDVCPIHESMKSKAKKPGHDQKSSHVLKVLEDAKFSNKDDVDKQVAKYKDKRTKLYKQAQENQKTVTKFNADLDEEWAELVQNDYAYDENIYNQVVLENQQAGT